MLGLRERVAARAFIGLTVLSVGITGLLPTTAGAGSDPPGDASPPSTEESVPAPPSTEPLVTLVDESLAPPESTDPTVPNSSTDAVDPSEPDSTDVPDTSEAAVALFDVAGSLAETAAPDAAAASTEALDAAPEMASLMMMAMALPPPPTCSVRVNLGASWMPGTSCLETRLGQLGFFGGAANDLFDGVTGQALLDYQLSVGLAPTGQPDLATLTSLEIWAGPGAAPCSVRVGLGAPWMPGNSCLERRLADLGLFWGSPNDLFTYETAVGVSLYQQSAGLGNSAMPDQGTLSSLGIWAGPGGATCTVRVGLGATWMPGNTCLEQRLTQLGLFSKAPDDIFDWDTMVGVSLYQQSAGLANSASPDQTTLTRLGIWAGQGAASCSVKIGLGATWMPGNACLEQRLAQLGLFWRTPDDIFDWDTMVGVSLYQQSARYANTASPNRTTLTYLGIWVDPGPASCSVTRVVSPQSPAGTTCVEQRLASLGLFFGTPNDVYDWETAVAVSLFQQSVRLFGTGTADAATLVALGVLSDPNPLPANSGSGRRIVYSRAQQRIWAVDDSGHVVKTHAVSGRLYEPYAGTYYVYSRSEYTYSTKDPTVRWRYMVRFAYGPEGGRIGFHEIPNRNGRPLQSREQLGLPLSGGCVRQSTEDALWVWNWAPIGTKVVVL